MTDEELKGLTHIVLATVKRSFMSQVDRRAVLGSAYAVALRDIGDEFYVEGVVFGIGERYARSCAKRGLTRDQFAFLALEAWDSVVTEKEKTP